MVGAHLFLSSACMRLVLRGGLLACCSLLRSPRGGLCVDPHVLSCIPQRASGQRQPLGCWSRWTCSRTALQVRVCAGSVALKLCFYRAFSSSLCTLDVCMSHAGSGAASETSRELQPGRATATHTYTRTHTHTHAHTVPHLVLHQHCITPAAHTHALVSEVLIQTQRLGELQGGGGCWSGGGKR